MKEVYYGGLDVHKDSIQMAVLDQRNQEPLVAKGLPNRATRIVKELAKYQAAGEIQIAYTGPDALEHQNPGETGGDKQNGSQHDFTGIRAAAASGEQSPGEQRSRV
jgi:hypothetical protein